MSRPLQHMQNLKPIFILFRPWGIGQGRKRKNSVFLVMIIGTFGVNIEGNLKTGFGVQPRKISLGTMAPLGRKWIFIDAPRRTTRGFRKDLPLKNATRMSSATMLYFPLRIVCSPSASSLKTPCPPRLTAEENKFGNNGDAICFVCRHVYSRA